jgi:translocation and assembly module TamA
MRADLRELMLCGGKSFVLLCCALALSAGASARAESDWPPVEEPAPEQDARDSGALKYDATISGVEDGGLHDLLESASQLVALADRPPATIAALERRTQDDLVRLREVLRSEGYYDAALDYRLDTEKRPVEVRIEIVPGTRYKLTAFKITYEGAPSPRAAAEPSLADIGVTPGMPARAPDVRSAEKKAVDVLQWRGYPFAKGGKLKATVRHDAKEMSVQLPIDVGPPAVFGDLRITGLKSVEEDYIRRIAVWQPGETFDQRKLDALRGTLNGTGLFKSVKVTKAAEVGSDGRIPITAEVVESPPRSIGAGLRFSTDVGPGADLFWEHRNYFQRNETLGFSVTAAFNEQVGRANFRKPAFLQPQQALLSNAEISNRNTDAFDQQSIAGTLSLERPLIEKWRGTAGVTASYDILQDSDGEQHVKLFGLPLTASRITTDNALNPTRGMVIDLSATPYAGTSDQPLQFLRTSAGGSTYYAIDKDARFILAGRTKVGTILGEASASLPADKRFYAGGGGSVRGYEFQKVGPLDADNNPLGGRSLLELSGELRIRVTETIGVVPFIDGGAVSEEPYPTFEEGMRWAGGLGLRYFTGFGPLRLDVAFPINGRDVDSLFEFYVSFGQAF